MKKIVLYLMMLLLVVQPALAKSIETETVHMLTGLVTEITEEGLMLDADETGPVLALITEDTVLETSRDIQPGDYVYIDFNGQLTRSIPAQITALTVRMHMIHGSVTEQLPEENAVMLETESHGPVYVVLPKDWQGAQTDSESLIVFFDGAMTMSLPPHIGAGHALPGYTLEGEVTQTGEGFFTVGTGMEAVEVLFSGEMPQVGDQVTVLHDGQMTRSIPAQVTALDVTIANPEA